jgi:hypothetical protein
VGLLESLVSSIASLGQSIVNGLIDGLKTLFIPRTDYFSTKISILKDTLFAKMPFINQISVAMSEFIQIITYSSSTKPVFSFTMYGKTMNIIDFSMFESYRLYIHGIILFFAYFYYIRRVIKSLPGLIGGFYR